MAESYLMNPQKASRLGKFFTDGTAAVKKNPPRNKSLAGFSIGSGGTFRQILDRGSSRF